MKDKLDITDGVRSGLSTDPSGRCKGQYQEVCHEVRTLEGPLDYDRWCAWCRSKHKPQVN